jgi:hypothetical protein
MTSCPCSREECITYSQPSILGVPPKERDNSERLSHSFVHFSSSWVVLYLMYASLNKFEDYVMLNDENYKSHICSEIMNNHSTFVVSNGY